MELNKLTLKNLIWHDTGPNSWCGVIDGDYNILFEICQLEDKFLLSSNIRSLKLNFHELEFAQQMAQVQLKDYLYSFFES